MRSLFFWYGSVLSLVLCFSCPSISLLCSILCLSSDPSSPRTRDLNRAFFKLGIREDLCVLYRFSTFCRRSWKDWRSLWSVGSLPSKQMQFSRPAFIVSGVLRVALAGLPIWKYNKSCRRTSIMSPSDNVAFCSPTPRRLDRPVSICNR